MMMHTAPVPVPKRHSATPCNTPASKSTERPLLPFREMRLVFSTSPDMPSSSPGSPSNRCVTCRALMRFEPKGSRATNASSPCSLACRACSKNTVVRQTIGICTSQVNHKYFAADRFTWSTQGGEEPMYLPRSTDTVHKAQEVEREYAQGMHSLPEGWRNSVPFSQTYLLGEYTGDDEPLDMGRSMFGIDAPTTGTAIIISLSL